MDLLRFIAIISILYCHFSDILYPFFSGKGEILFNLSNWITGYYGVELFFVLSGFLIGNIYIKGIVHNTDSNYSVWNQVKDFWLRRWIRTLPNYYLFVLINLVVYAVVDYKIDIKGILKALFFLQKIDSLIPVTFFGVSWSLAVEEWFYLLMPLFFLGVFFFSKNKRISFLVAVSCLFIIPICNKLIYCFQHLSSANRHDEVFRYTTFYRIDAIGFGVLFSWFWTKESLNILLTKHKKGLFLTGLLLLLFSFIYIYLFIAKMEQNPFLFASLSSICCIAVLCCFPFVLYLEAKPSSLFYRIVLFVSLSSYSLYLCHCSVLQLFDYFFLDMFDSQNLILVLFYILTLLFTCLAIAHFIYRCFEKPILNKRDSIIKKQKF